MTLAHKFRVGAVSYLNTLPLVYGLEDRHPECSLVYDLPSRLADRLSGGELDVALIPSIEVFQNPQYTVVSDACIACHGPVWSVKLMSRVPLDSIRHLALDEGSRTSVALARIMLDQQFGVRPELSPLLIDQPWQTSNCDAVLIIGDRAMNPERHPEFDLQVDLGNWWSEFTGLPFVFAMWTARAGLSTDQLDQTDKLLSQCRDVGIGATSEIAAAHAERFGLTGQECVNYFQKYLHFTLGNLERQGLARFREMATRMELAPDSPQLQFHDC